VSYGGQVPDAQSFDGFAAEYDRFASLEPSTLLEWLLTQLPSNKRRALDAGCGSGRLTLALAGRFDQVVGIDISEPLINIARRQRSRPNVQYRVDDLTAYQDTAGFDLVLSSTTLHHLPELESALMHLRLLLRPGGTAILIDNVAWWRTPPSWVYVLGAARRFPVDVHGLGWGRAIWLLHFRTSGPWLGHLASDRYLSRPEFEQQYGVVFPGGRFHELGWAHALVWRMPAS
jgi:SAM-dependent methyltransferase